MKSESNWEDEDRPEWLGHAIEPTTGCNLYQDGGVPVCGGIKLRHIVDMDDGGLYQCDSCQRLTMGEQRDRVR